MDVDVIRAWPRRFEIVRVVLPEGACVLDAVIAAGWGSDPDAVAYSIFGQRVPGDAPVHEGDRVELLRPLLADPKDARRRRAASRTP